MGNPFGPLQDTMATFTWTEVATALVRFKGLHEGHWRVATAMDLDTMAVQTPAGPVPAAIVTIGALVLVREKQAGALTVDAASVNPPSRIVLPGRSAGILE